EFLEYRYNQWARLIMAVATLGIYMLLLGAVTYSGALTISSLAAQMGYTVSLQIGALAIGLIAGAYVFAGGLKACAWADLIQGSALILGGAIIVFFAFDKLGNATEAAQVMDLSTGAVSVTPLAEGTGSIERFWELNKIRMNMFLPATDSILPWTALLVHYPENTGLKVTGRRPEGNCFRRIHETVDSLCDCDPRHYCV
ncbi:MAG: sodium:solute symporter family transporter, partial [Planctomycetota bacterium]